jgi:hypothetical protein
MTTTGKRKRWTMVMAVSVPLVVAAVGLHTRAGRSLLGFGASGCPWEKSAPSAERLEDFRVKNAAALKTNATARTRPAFGFDLDKSSRADVTAWGTRTGAKCTEELAGAAMRCESVDRSALEEGAESGVAIKDAFFRFDPRGVLVGVDLMRDGTDGEKAAAVLESVTKRIADAAGPPSTVHGTASPAHLAGYLNRAASEFRFADYAADVSATNLGEQGVVVREQYRSIPN